MTRTSKQNMECQGILQTGATLRPPRRNTKKTVARISVGGHACQNIGILVLELFIEGAYRSKLFLDPCDVSILKVS